MILPLILSYSLLMDGQSIKMIHLFHRRWPNVIKSDQKTINKVDEIWDRLNVGDFF